MKINKNIKIFVLSFLAFCLLGFTIVYIQDKMFENLIENGKYTIGVGERFEKRRTGWDFIYSYSVNNVKYEGIVAYSNGETGLDVGSIYFLVFNPQKVKSSFLIRTPSVPSFINKDSVPKNGWKELPVQIEKDSIKRW
jgi:hypothetical protein